MNHSVLLRQMKKVGINEKDIDEKTIKLLDLINKFYYKQDEERTRLSHLIETITNENEVLITDLKHQSELAISESKMSALGEMSAGIAHEINNPLMILQTIIAIIEDSLESCSIENKSFILEQVKEADSTIDRISKIVQGLKTFSRDGKSDPFTTCSIQEIIDDTLSLCGEKIKQSKIKLTNTVDPSLKISCRPSQISQVFLNLILNSRDAILDSNDRWINIESITKENNLIIRFIDSGRGIPLQVQEKIMNPFFTTKPIGKGTGLGLSISKGIVEAHNGSIRIDNGCENTCFELEFKKA